MIINAAKAQEAAGILGVELDTLGIDELTKAYRIKAREHHPDSADNYDAEQWARVSWAKEVLVRWVEQRFADAAMKATGGKPPSKGNCRSCGGTGRVALSKPKGFGAKPTTMMCVMCNGSGQQPEGGAKAFAGD